MITAEEIVTRLGLEPHPLEGGFFRETWRATDEITLDRLGSRRYAAGTAIYYLLTPETFSELHRLPIDEVFHFYLGDPVEMLWLANTGSRVITLGTDLARGHLPQVTVPADTWQGSRIAGGGRHGFALLGTTMAPGFDAANYQRGERDALVESWPGEADRIRALTR